jgi:hypothetical protein
MPIVDAGLISGTLIRVMIRLHAVSILQLSYQSSLDQNKCIKQPVKSQPSLERLN